MDENKYSIGRFAAILGIDADTIRYYEKIGLLQSRRDENNYRYYTDTDCRKLMTCRELRALGFSIKQIQSAQCDFESEQFAGFLGEREREIDREIEYLHAVQKQLRICREAAQRAGKKPEMTIVRRRQGYYFFRQTDNVKLVDHQSAVTVKKLMDLQPLVFRGGVVSREELLSGKPYDILKFACGLMVEKGALKDSSLIRAADALFTWELCAQVLVSGDFSQEDSGELQLRALLEEICAQGYEIGEAAISRILPSNVDAGRWHLLYSIPLKEAAPSPTGKTHKKENGE